MDGSTRYSRQIRLAEVGEAGQDRLRSASVIVIGAGGLGSPALHHLAGSGVGTLGVVDFDKVDLSNLHRQTLYSSSDVGTHKTDSARRRLNDINSDVVIREHRLKLDASNARELLDQYDLVLDGSDTFSTRYVVNEASVRTRTPNVFASVNQFSGQASVFGTENGPCYRCLFPEPPPQGLIPNCDEGGVLGVVPAMLGTVQATEALKLILGVGTSLVGRLFMYDALDLSSREISIDRDPHCRTCGDGEPIADDASIAEISAAELRGLVGSRASVELVDVRTHDERAKRSIGGTHIPISQLDARIDELAPHRGREIVVYCASGVRSERAAKILQSHGHRVRSLRGGLKSWNLG
ncbi:molybdopterin-synthase adenylyltransferase MoeB [Rubrivirga sp.]|uniref:molybdopterin-synthase adenylyltransferase MoeB n=1 Tax=Rubrivirga sp. TaxID=1885344 RepID=UPI003C70CEC3